MALLRKAGRHLLASRSVHLDIHPRPANLSESREVLRVLQGFGAVDVYKSLRHERPVEAPNTAFAVFRDPEAAQKALSASPLRYALETVKEDEVREEERLEEPEKEEQVPGDGVVRDGVEEITRPSLLLNEAPEQRWGRFGSIHESPAAAEAAVEEEMEAKTEEPSPKDLRWFHVNVDRTRAVYQDYVERQPYYVEFNVMKSMMQQDLDGKVPHVGLSDVTMRPDNFTRTPNRVLQKKAREVASIKTLRGLWEDAHRKEKDGEVAEKTDEKSQDLVSSWGLQEGKNDQWGQSTSQH